MYAPDWGVSHKKIKSRLIQYKTLGSALSCVITNHQTAPNISNNSDTESTVTNEDLKLYHV